MPEPRRAFGVVRSLFLVLGAGPSIAAAAPEGTLTFAMHFSPVTRWLDPAEGESTITPFLLLYPEDAVDQASGVP